MKIFKIHFIGALRGDQALYREIINQIENLGYKIVTTHSATRKKEDIEKESLEESKNYNAKMIGWIKKSDIVLVEATVSNFGAGYEIATSLKLGRPVIVIYQKLDHNTPYVLLGEKDTRLIVEEYTKNNLLGILKSTLKEAEKFTFERFTLILPTPLIKHLDKISESGTTRSEYIRRLISNDINKK